MSEYEPRDYATIDEFFLRRLRAGARPIGEGLVSPADGIVFDAGTIDSDRAVWIKGQRQSLARVVNGERHRLALDRYEGGAYALVFLTPHGYHRLHAPCDATLEDVQWIAGRYFPQNERALERIAGVHERNERLVLRLTRPDGELLMVMVGASLVGGIHLEAAPRHEWTVPGTTRIGRRIVKGEEIGHFAFGSTVVVMASRELGLAPRIAFGDRVRMGEALFSERRDGSPLHSSGGDARGSAGPDRDGDRRR